jgi:hypothetical protein
MLWKRLVTISVLWTCMARCALAAECGSSPPKQINVYSGSTSSLQSPDKQWKLISVGLHPPGQSALLYIENTQSSRKWNFGSIERDGTLFWSEDSKRLFLRDEYAADDTKIRVFDVTGSVPKEIEGLDRGIRRAIFAHIPENETTLWLYYPQVCFAANDSSTITVVADAPLVRKDRNSKGKSFDLKLTVSLITLQIVTSIPARKSSQ